MRSLLWAAYQLGRIVEAVWAMYAPPPPKPWQVRIGRLDFGVVVMDPHHVVRVTEVE